MAIIMKASPSKDGKVGEVDVRIPKDGAQKVLSRPIMEVVLISSPGDSKWKVKLSGVIQGPQVESVMYSNLFECLLVVYWFSEVISR